MLQPLKFGVSAVTADGRDVGTLYRVVVAEQVLPEGPVYTVIAVTVRRRLMESGNLLKPGGWDAPRDLKVPFTQVTGADEDEARLSLTEEEFLALPPYIIGDVPEPEPGSPPPPGFRAEDITMRVGALLGGALYEPPHDEQENRGPSERHVSQGSGVWRGTPHEHIGDLDRVLMDDVSNAVAGLVVRRGALFTHEVVVPARAITVLLDDLVHVELPGNTSALEEYRTE